MAHYYNRSIGVGGRRKGLARDEGMCEECNSNSEYKEVSKWWVTRCSSAVPKKVRPRDESLGCLQFHHRLNGHRRVQSSTVDCGLNKFHCRKGYLSWLMDKGRHSSTTWHQCVAFGAGMSLFFLMCHISFPCMYVSSCLFWICRTSHPCPFGPIVRPSNWSPYTWVCCPHGDKNNSMVWLNNIFYIVYRSWGREGRKAKQKSKLKLNILRSIQSIKSKHRWEIYLNVNNS